MSRNHDFVGTARPPPDTVLSGARRALWNCARDGMVGGRARLVRLLWCSSSAMRPLRGFWALVSRAPHTCAIVRRHVRYGAFGGEVGTSSKDTFAGGVGGDEGMCEECALVETSSALRLLLTRDLVEGVRKAGTLVVLGIVVRRAEGWVRWRGVRIHVRRWAWGVLCAVTVVVELSYDGGSVCPTIRHRQDQRSDEGLYVGDVQQDLMEYVLLRGEVRQQMYGTTRTGDES